MNDKEYDQHVHISRIEKIIQAIVHQYMSEKEGNVSE